MLHTIISYLSRFSRLVLLTFALVIVLILVLFTINSASDDDISEVNDSAISAPAPESEVTTEQSVTYDETASGESLVIINESSGATSIDASGNPQNFTANSIDLDSGDTVTIITTDADTQAALEAELEKGHVSSTSTTLPSTGPASTIATAVGLMALTGVGIAYVRSKKNLSLGLLQINR